MGTCVLKRDQRLNLSNLTEVLLEHCKKLEYLLIYPSIYLVCPSLKQPTNTPAPKQKKLHSIPAPPSSQV